MTVTTSVRESSSNHRSSTRRHRVSLDSTSIESRRPDHDNDVDLAVSKITTPKKRKQNPTATLMTTTMTPTTIESNMAPGEFDTVDDEEDEEKNDDVEVYHFNGVNYTSYQDMVQAKRQRNQHVLEQSGLLSSSLSSSYQERRSDRTSKIGVKRGIQASKSNHRTATTKQQQPQQRRQSSRLLGIESDGLYIDEERAGRVTVVGGTTAATTSTDGPVTSKSSTVYSTTSMNHNPAERFYRNRINDGTPVSLSDAMEQAGKKWMSETSISEATTFVQQILAKSTPPTALPTGVSSIPNDSTSSPARRSYEYDATLVQELHCDDVDRNVAKLCPDRIYSMAVHPSTHHLIVSAGDKSGHVGIWNVTDDDSDDVIPDHSTDTDHDTNPNGSNAKVTASSSRDGIHLFKPHTGAVCSLQWTCGSDSGSSHHHLISASYDGTIRMLDVQQEQFLEVFATYDLDQQFQHRPGYGTEQEYGNKFWTQHIAIDPRYNTDACFFLSTSVGTAMHIDVRKKHPITFHEQFSEKKINTLRYVYFSNES